MAAEHIDTSKRDDGGGNGRPRHRYTPGFPSQMATIVRGERGTEKEAKLPSDPAAMLAWANAYVADRRRRGVSPQGILFDGETAA